DRLHVTASTLGLASAAATGEHSVELVEARRDRDRHHEVGAREFHQSLDLPLVVALAGPTEAVAEQIMAAQLGKSSGALALPVAADLRHRDRRIVVQDRARHAAEEGER